MACKTTPPIESINFTNIQCTITNFYLSNLKKRSPKKEFRKIIVLGPLILGPRDMIFIMHMNGIMNQWCA